MFLRAASDPEFQRRISEDPELRRIAERADMRERDGMETAAALGSPCRLCGVDMPQPTAGVLSLLELIESPFIVGGKQAGRRDFEKAAYIMHAKSKAVAPIFAALRFDQRLQEMKAAAEADSENLVVWLRYANESAKAWAEFDMAAARFADGMGAYRIDEAIKEMSDYLSLCAGFELIPDSPGSEKKTG